MMMENGNSIFVFFRFIPLHKRVWVGLFFSEKYKSKEFRCPETKLNNLSGNQTYASAQTEEFQLQ